MRQSAPLIMDVRPCIQPITGFTVTVEALLGMEGVMTSTTTRRPQAQTRRLGYGFGAMAGVVGLFLINVWPGWEAVPFLTTDTTEVLWLVNAAMLAGIAADLVYLVYDAPWLVALGGVVTTGVGLAALIRIEQVFPVDFGNWEFDGTVLVRILLILGIAGTAIAIVVQSVSLVRRVTNRREE